MVTQAASNATMANSVIPMAATTSLVPAIWFFDKGGDLDIVDFWLIID